MLDDSFDALLRQRIIFLRGPLDARTADLAIAQLLHLDTLESTREIALYINCPSADLRAALALYDVMENTRAPVRTLCLGMAAGGGALLLAGGAQGRRGALPNARISLYSARREVSGTVGEIDVQARELLRLRQQVHELLSRHTGQSLERIERDAERERWLSAEEAKAYGIIDEVVAAPKSAGQDEGFPSS
jgi:ATP-dependent Clp protease protease subunit